MQNKTYEDRPDVHKDEQRKIGPTVDGEDEWEEVVWNRLEVSIYGVERMRSKGRRHDPLVMGLVDMLIEEGKVQPAVNPVHQVVGEHQKPAQCDISTKGALNARRDIYQGIEKM